MPLPTGNLYDNFLIHGCYYRMIDDLSVPWVPSPVVLPRELEPDTEGQSQTSDGSAYLTASPSTFTSSIDDPQIPHTRHHDHQAPPLKHRKNQKKLVWISLLFERLLTIYPKSPAVDVSQQDNRPTTSARRNRTRTWPSFQWNGPFPPTPPMDVVPLSEWKAWGYYACPRINTVYVRNHLPAPQYAPPIPLKTMFDLLRIPDETDSCIDEAEHPERWIRGQKHPAFPPRPKTWKPLDPSEPLPFPWECQINPIFQLLDLDTHTPTVAWDLSDPTTANAIRFYTGPNSKASYMNRPDYLQPATWPFVTHMYLNGIAFASDPDGWWARDYKSPWPIMIVNREGSEGIFVDDVIHGIKINFETPIGHRDWERWSDGIRLRAREAYHLRIESSREVETHPIMRRVDFLGTNMYLYGLRPSAYLDPGWTLLMGPQPPM